VRHTENTALSEVRPLSSFLCDAEHPTEIRFVRQVVDRVADRLRGGMHVQELPLAAELRCEATMTRLSGFGCPRELTMADLLRPAFSVSKTQEELNVLQQSGR
jgi:hypothetical protein